MIQDIAPHILLNQYRITDPQPGDSVFCFYDDRILLKQEGSIVIFPKVSDLNVRKEDLIYLFSVDEVHLFLYMNEAELSGFEYAEFRQLRRQQLEPKETAFAIFTAYHLAGWYRDSRYCGRCGKKTVHSQSERAMKCPACGNIIYPRINPAVIVGVINKDRLLITKYARGFGGSALVAGFTEIGETFEETVAREVREETGLSVTNIHYYKSQPWGPAADLLAGYYCEVDGSDEITVDHSELKTAEWVKREDIVLQDHEWSLTNEMMKLFKEGKI
jgi:NAD+ diphosphatase